MWNECTRLDNFRTLCACTRRPSQNRRSHVPVVLTLVFLADARDLHLCCNAVCSVVVYDCAYRINIYTYIEREALNNHTSIRTWNKTTEPFYYTCMVYQQDRVHVRTHFIDHNNLPDMLWDRGCRRRLFVELSIFMGDIAVVVVVFVGVGGNIDSKPNQRQLRAKTMLFAMLLVLCCVFMAYMYVGGSTTKPARNERNVYHIQYIYIYFAQCMQRSCGMYVKALHYRRPRARGGKTSKWRAEYFNRVMFYA